MYIVTMPINVTQQQMEWLEAEVAAGRCTSVDAAVQMIINEHIRQVSSDPAWASALIDQVRCAIAQGDPETLNRFSAFIDSRHGSADH